MEPARYLCTEIACSVSMTVYIQVGLHAHNAWWFTGAVSVTKHRTVRTGPQYNLNLNLNLIVDGPGSSSAFDVHIVRI